MRSFVEASFSTSPRHDCAARLESVLSPFQAHTVAQQTLDLLLSENAPAKRADARFGVIRRIKLDHQDRSNSKSDLRQFPPLGSSVKDKYDIAVSFLDQPWFSLTSFQEIFVTNFSVDVHSCPIRESRPDLQRYGSTPTVGGKPLLPLRCQGFQVRSSRVLAASIEPKRWHSSTSGSKALRGRVA